LFLVEVSGTTRDNFEAEANSNSLCLRFAEGDILTEFRVPVGHGLVTVPDPETQQVFRSSLFPKMRNAETPEGMEADQRDDQLLGGKPPRAGFGSA
jgi:hypothetical protein